VTAPTVTRGPGSLTLFWPLLARLRPYAIVLGLTILWYPLIGILASWLVLGETTFLTAMALPVLFLGAWASKLVGQLGRRECILEKGPPPAMNGTPIPSPIGVSIALYRRWFVGPRHGVSLVVEARPGVGLAVELAVFAWFDAARELADELAALFDLEPVQVTTIRQN
jgi:hypothetical protein